MSNFEFLWDCEVMGQPLSPDCSYWDDIAGCTAPDGQCPYEPSCFEEVAE